MLLNSIEFLIRQLPGFVDDVFIDKDFSNIM